MFSFDIQVLRVGASFPEFFIRIFNVLLWTLLFILWFWGEMYEMNRFDFVINFLNILCFYLFLFIFSFSKLCPTNYLHLLLLLLMV